MTTIDDEHQYPRSDQSLIEQLQTQLIHNQLHRKQARDYTRKLSEYNTPPAAWYGTSFIPRSIYVYDPRYQKTVHQSISSLQRARSDLRFTSSRPRHELNPLQHHPSLVTTPRRRYMLDLCNTALASDQHKLHTSLTSLTTSGKDRSTPMTDDDLPSRLSTVPPLPPIVPSKQTAHDLSNPDHGKQDDLSETSAGNALHPIESAPMKISSKKRFNDIIMPSLS